MRLLPRACAGRTARNTNTARGGRAAALPALAALVAVVALVALAEDTSARTAAANARAEAAAESGPGREAVAAAEALYADWLDAGAAVDTIDSALMATVEGRDRAGWFGARSRARHELETRLWTLHEKHLGTQDARAALLMRRALAEAGPDPPAEATTTAGSSPPPDQPKVRCDAARQLQASAAELEEALYGCFVELGDDIPFEGRRIVRTTALALLAQLDTAERRRALFAAFAPLWTAINSDDSPASPYRRLLRAAGAEARASGHSPITAAVAALGTQPATAELWLVAVLDAWRRANPGPPIEPWNYWYHYASASRELDARVPLTAIGTLTRRYYSDLGVDFDQVQVLEDLAPRPGKRPYATADHVRIGRLVDGAWRPAMLTVSANYEHGGLFVLNELVHEYGHAAHEAAIRTRPAFYSMGEPVFYEAFADVPAWSMADPAWQRRYLGAAAEGSGAGRELFSNVMLDVAWSLFEMRLLRSPDIDPNVLWSDIARQYLNVVPHPELSWWAMRVQLVETPGYMINYGLGAVLTAELRAQVRAAIGPFDAGNARWYDVVSARLLSQGAAVDTPVVLRRFLSRPVTPAALIAELRRIQRAGATSTPR